MQDEATCSFCERPAEDRCRRCGRRYCGDHGGAFCADCLHPASALPSGRLVRWAAALFALGLAFGVLFLVASPRLPGEAEPASRSPDQPAATAAALLVSPTAEARATPTATPTATATPTRDYTVQAGDTLASIASASGVTAADLQQANPTVDPNNLAIGQTIHIPVKPP